MAKQLVFIKLLLLRLGIALLLFTAIRLVFFAFNHYLFPNHSVGEFLTIFISGARFDLSALVYVNLLVIAGHILPIPQRSTTGYQTGLKWIFFLFNGLALCFELADIEFFKFTLRRTSINLADQANDVLSLFVTAVIDFWYLVVIFIVLMRLAHWLYRKTEKLRLPKSLSLIPQIIVLLVAAGLTVIAARGGLQLFPIMPITAAQYVTDVRSAPLVSNTTLNIIHSVQQRRVEPYTFYSQEELDQQFTLHRKDKTPGLPNKQNIMIIIMESHGKNVMSRYNDYEGFTPFLDSMIGEGLSSKITYANGRQSNQGIVSILSGIPALMEDPLMISSYQNNKINSIGSYLKGMGYTSHFFHPGNNGTFSLDRYAKYVGFDGYYGNDEFGNDRYYDGNWGAFDYPFNKWTVRELSKLDTPFCSVLLSINSHHPFNVEPWFEELHPNMSEYERSFRYADACLRVFFEEAAKTDWFDNTLFVLTADHMGYVNEGHYKTRYGMYEVPIVFYHPDGSLKGMTPNTIQHTDLLPSLLDYVNYPEPFSCFGHSIFDHEKPPYSYMFVNGIYQVVDTSHILLFDGNKSLGLFDYKVDPLLKNNLMEKDLLTGKRLEARLKLVIQRHHGAMIGNEL